MVDLSVEIAGLRLRNPILSASGTFGHGLEMGGLVAPELLGAWVSKTVTVNPRPGNPSPRIAETEAGLLNSIGLENRGLEHYLTHVLPEVAHAPTAIITNIGGENAEEFAALAAVLEGRSEVDALEVNLSCPNVDGGRLPFATRPEVTEAVIRGVRQATGKPILAKLSPNVTRIADLARAAESGGADAITATNTALGMGVDWRARQPLLNTVVGGYSGTGLKPIALRCAWECCQAVSIPVIGCGGIATADDVLEFLVAGCRAVQVGTASFHDPETLGRLPGELRERLEEVRAASIDEWIGTLGCPPPCPHH